MDISVELNGNKKDPLPTLDTTYFDVQSVTLSKGPSISILLLHTKATRTQTLGLFKPNPALFFRDQDEAEQVYTLMKSDLEKDPGIVTKYRFSIRNLEHFIKTCEAGTVNRKGSIMVHRFLGTMTKRKPNLRIANLPKKKKNQ